MQANHEREKGNKRTDDRIIERINGFVKLKGGKIGKIEYTQTE